MNSKLIFSQFIVFFFGVILLQGQEITADTIELQAKDQIVQIALPDSVDEGILGDFLVKVDSIVNPKSAIYGHQFLLNQRFATDDVEQRAAVGPRYVLGAGDEITISIFGAAQFDSRFVINADGYISPSNMPKIFLKGVEWAKAVELMKSRFKQFYLFRSDQFSAAVTRPRDVTVHVLGEVLHPGTYRVNAVHSVLQVLSQAGGVAESGSVRNILMSDGVTQKNLDIYQLITDPSTIFDLQVEEGMVIQVPVATQVVKATGFKKSMKYELKANEGMRALINFSGGLSANSVKDFAQVYRYQGATQELVDVDLERILSGSGDFSLRDGDEVVVSEIVDQSDNMISVTGAVELPGDYALVGNEKLSTFLRKVRVKRNADLDAAFLLRMRADSTIQIVELDLNDVLNGGKNDITLQPKDELVINSQVNALDKATFKVSGAVRREVEYPFSIDSTLTLRQAILISGGLKSNAADEGYVIRRGVNNKEEIEYVKVNVKEAYLQPNSSSNQILQPNDEVVILENEDYTELSYIQVSGAVNKPQKLQYAERLNIPDVLQLSGGLSSSASGAIDIYRIEQADGEPVKTVQHTIQLGAEYQVLGEGIALQPADEIVVRVKEEYAKQILVTIEGEVKYQGRYALTQSNESISGLIAKAGGLTDEAFIDGVYILREKEKMHEGEIKKSSHKVVVNSISSSIVLQEGDKIVVPRIKNTVTIMVSNTLYGEAESDQIEVPFSGLESAIWYIEEYAGGLTDKDNRSYVTVRYANGATQAAKKKLFGYKYPTVRPGATIEVLASIQNPTVESQSEYPKLKKGVIINMADTATPVNVEENE